MREMRDGGQEDSGASRLHAARTVAVAWVEIYGVRVLVDIRTAF